MLYLTTVRRPSLFPRFAFPWSDAPAGSTAPLRTSRLCSEFFLLLLFPFCTSPCRPQNAGPRTFESLSKRAGEARDADRLDDAVILYKRALTLQPKWAEGWWSLGTLEYDRNNYEGAARAFRNLVSLAPKDGTARVMLGLCEFELGDDIESLKNIREGRSLGISNNPQLREVVLYHQGILLLRFSKFKIAQETLGILCKDGSPTDQLFDSMGLAVMRVLPKEAPGPATPGARVVRGAGYGACLSKQKKFERAHAEYKSLLTDYPDYPNLHYAAGLDYVEANDVPAAVDQFKQELRRDPANIAARLEIATTLYKVDSNAALEYAGEVVRSEPQLPFPHYLLGLLYLDTGEHRKAVPELEAAQRAFPKDSRLYIALASAYSRVGRKQDADKARATYERLAKESGSETQATY